MKTLFLAVLLSLGAYCEAQNLVMNPGFEDYDSLPCDYIISPLQFSNMLHHWTVPNNTTPDLCSPLIPLSCNYGNPFCSGSAGGQTPRSGDLMIGMVCENGGYNEYIQVPLTSPLVIGNLYQVELYVSLAERSDFANNNIGVYFSDTIISDSTFQSTNYIPQILDTDLIADTANWVLISGCFTANTAVQYLTIGNFISPVIHSFYNGGGWPMAYYYFDDISVTEIKSGGSQVNCTVGIDENDFEKSTVYPNPVSDFLILDNLKIGSEIKIIDCLGKLVYFRNDLTEHMKIDVQFLAKGFYILNYTTKFGQSSFQLVKE